MLDRQRTLIKEEQKEISKKDINNENIKIKTLIYQTMKNIYL